jgi:Protein of unknown function (DUF2793)
MDKTGRFDLPLIMPSQAQKHVTHNEALTLLDGLVHLVIKSSGDLVPPLSAVTDDAFVIGSPASGAWFGHDGEIAFNTDAGWRFASAVRGMLALFSTEVELRIFDGGLWHPAGEYLGALLFNALGINTGADSVNRLSVRSNAALFTAISAALGGNGSVQVKLNKETAADTASLVFQDGFSGRAEIGLVGNDDFAIKVSPDGTVWHQALTINASNGALSLPQDSVGNATLSNMEQGRIKGRTSAGTGDPEDLTPAQLTSLVEQFSSMQKGLAPASGGGSSTYLRADGVWAAPAGGGGASVFAAQIDFGSLPVFSKIISLTHSGAAPGQKVMISLSADLPVPLSMDELEMDSLNLAGAIISPDTIQILITACPGPVSGLRNLNYLLS